MQNTPTFQTTAAYNMHPFVQNQPHVNQHNAHNHPNRPIFQNYPMVQNVGYLVSTATTPPSGVPNNTVPRSGHQRQMLGNPNSTPVANQVYANQAFTSAHASVMASQAHPVQPAQPAQPAAPSMDETIALFKGLMEEDTTDFQDHIQGFKDLARFAEAEKRANLVPTPELARDFPADTDRQVDVAHGFFNSLVCWKTQNQPMSSKVAANRIKSKKLIEFKIVAWKLLVDKSQALVSVDTN